MQKQSTEDGFKNCLACRINQQERNARRGHKDPEGYNERKREEGQRQIDAVKEARGAEERRNDRGYR